MQKTCGVQEMPSRQKKYKPNSNTDQMSRSLKDLNRQLKEYKSRVARLTTANQILQNKISTLRSELNAARKALHQSTSPTTHIDVRIAALKQQLDSVQKSYNAIRSDRDLLVKTQNEQTTEQEQQVKQLAELQQKYAKSQQELMSAKAKIEEQNSEILGLEAKVKSTEHARMKVASSNYDLREEITNLNNEIKFIKAILNNSTTIRNRALEENRHLLAALEEATQDPKPVPQTVYSVLNSLFQGEENGIWSEKESPEATSLKL